MRQYKYSWACLRRLIWSFAAILVLLQVGGSGVYAHSGGELLELHEDNWQLMLDGEWMVEFFAPWCPACKNLAPTWQRFATVAASANVKVAKIDVTTSPSLSGRFFVTALPTIYHVKDGEFRQYRGSRDGDALMYFVKQQHWKNIEPISSWKKPNTIHMSVLSYFFKLSHTLKDFNGRLQEEYGLPTWGSYALFAIGTIFVGAALGLMLVCVVDFLYPPKKSQRQSFSDSKGRSFEGDGVEDIANDEIEDDAPVNEDDNDEDEEEKSDDENTDDHGDNGGDHSDGDENKDDDDYDDEDDGSWSEREKDGESDSAAEPESEKNMKNPKKAAASAPTQPPAAAAAAPAATKKAGSSPTEVRKRKPRKAD